jgi:hypothetical protein
VAVVVLDEALSLPQPASAAKAMGRKKGQTGRCGMCRTIFSYMRNT